MPSKIKNRLDLACLYSLVMVPACPLLYPLFCCMNFQSRGNREMVPSLEDANSFPFCLYCPASSFTEILTYHTFAKLLPQKPEPPGKMSRRRLRDSISRRLEKDLGI